ncbi:hypothetical protein GEMRC1_006062 [Eukaryota sp. GEM-RC1]
MDSVQICQTKEIVAQTVADEIISLIIQTKVKNSNCVLCLPTGSTPIPVYRRICERAQEENIDFSHVYTFNLDEYCGLNHDHEESYHYFMNKHLFDHVNIPKSQIHIPEGILDQQEADAFAMEYEQKIKDLGGLHLTLLGIGRTGHLGFNEPGSTVDSRTRRVTLHNVTRIDATPSFQRLNEEVPRYAVTMGLGSILESKRVIMMATGETKAQIMKKFVDEEPNDQNPATFLKKHENYTVYVDIGAAKLLPCRKIINHDRLKIRRLERDDYYRGFLDILSQLTSVGEITYEKFTNRLTELSEDYHIYVAEDIDSGKVIATAALLVEKKFIHQCQNVGHIEDVVVHSLYRRQNLGRTLVRHLSSIAKTANCYKVILDCEDKNIEFYQKCGYKIKGGSNGYEALGVVD